ncbi:MAG: hypothetical protein WCA23_19145 [Stellaceae bacterium]
MKVLLERARAYLAGLEADRQTALALSEQKAEEAKLIKARQEGFQAALELFGGKASAGITASGKDGELCADRSGRDERAADVQEEPRQRRGRRPIRKLIVRELSFSGQPMTAAQIAKAIEYLADRTEIALERMEQDGQVVRSEAGRWSIGLSGTPQTNGHASARNGKLPVPA